jgi:hypothetical protein
LSGYHVLAADFHIHSFPFSWGVLSPWETIHEASRQGLDVIAMTPHNHTWIARAAKWLSTFSGKPTVLVGEEIHSIGYHVLAIGIHETIPWRQSAASAIEEVHRQGGVAIAAHPFGPYTHYDADALGKLDGAEVVHPVALRSEERASEMRRFFGLRPMTALGDSDYHLAALSPQVGDMSCCRTYLFVRERSEKDILDALREGHTVVYDRGHTYGDPAMIQLAAEDGRLPRLATAGTGRRPIVMFSGILGILGLLVSIQARKQ